MTREERLKKDGVFGEPILFYRPQDRWGIFSNFSLHPIIALHPFTGKPTEYATTEHRYQAMKATSDVEHNWVNESSTAFESKKRGAKVELREGWGNSYGDLCYFVMLEALLLKARQHQELLNALSRARSVFGHIYEDSPTDDIWGWRYREDHRGKNLLGRALMQTGDILLP